MPENILLGKKKEESAQDVLTIRNLTVTSDWTHIQIAIYIYCKKCQNCFAANALGGIIVC